MLLRVEVERYSLLADCRAEFPAGLSAITGETGAGKTLLLDAIDFALGARASSVIFPSDGGRCRVRLVFSLRRPLSVQTRYAMRADSEMRAELEPRSENSRPRSDEIGGSVDTWAAPAVTLAAGEHVIDRIARPGGGGRITLDGEKISAARAREIASALLDYSGQTENRALLSPSAHVAILDAFGDDAHAHLKRDFARGRARHAALLRKLSALEGGEAARLARIEKLTIECAELGRADVKSGERDSIAESRQQLGNAGQIAEQAVAILSIIGGDGDIPRGAGGAASSLSQPGQAAFAENRAAPVRDALIKCAERARVLAKLLGEESEAGEDWLAFAGEMAKMEASLGEVESAAARAVEKSHADPLELERVQTRLAEIDNMALKYGCLPDEIPGELVRRKADIEDLSFGDTNKDKLVAEIAEEAVKCAELASGLSAARSKASAKLVSRVLKYLKKLDFARCQFEVTGIGERSPAAEDDPETADAGSSKSGPGGGRFVPFREDGFDDVEFLVALNPGEPARPLARVASGGEMSRLMLAITAALAEHTSTPVLLFDEIEAGVGGITAKAIADVMADIAMVRQVISVSHLPQVAARAENHLVVTKVARAKESRITISEVTGEERRAELARMLGTDDAKRAELLIDEMLAP